MIKLTRPVVVEGRYDKIKLSSFIDGLIITTEGFGIYRDKGRMSLIKTLAHSGGIALLTDSDSAGFKIRSYIKNVVGKENVVDVYIPDVYGKEKRKLSPGKEGKLGVEGIDKDIIISAFLDAGLTQEGGINGQDSGEAITKLDLYEWGLYGRENSHALRSRLLNRLGLPERLSANDLPAVLERVSNKQTVLHILSSKEFNR